MWQQNGLEHQALVVTTRGKVDEIPSCHREQGRAFDFKP